MNKTENFIKEIRSIIQKLDTLDREYSDLHRDYNGSDFDLQNRCSGEVDNFVLALTHEMASTMSFYISDLQILLKYIDFRHSHKEYTDEDLSLLIDTENLSVKEKSEILQGKSFKNLQALKSEWNALFDNQSYQKIKEKIRLLTP